ncbi:Release factor glutamine methyltransferase [Neolecta irregularis DAH-3]|uniref:Release factor glutamine methyltransferase n=1 Tax=Neolecta irregularis (strain DAH-3) TaxID=1198029 RepID=A0A1U7LP85_NEOID|nr:Release factor glutamine methyltransferase [Neolecta irregularis DAH-3]|eukprot:OLL24465.1 Release factor glutamine methyltransferase [Neolecta irregularis DAH-3]
MRLADRIQKNKESQGIRIVDLCTGTGCIPLLLKSVIPDAHVLGIDVSQNAVKLSRRNANDNRVDVRFIQADIFEELPQIKTVDILTSNPPYVLESEYKRLHRSVRLYEPEIAVHGGDYFYFRILELAEKWEAKIVVLEAGDWPQCQRVKVFAVEQDWNASVGFDGASEGRYIVCWRKGYDWANTICDP